MRKGLIALSLMTAHAGFAQCRDGEPVMTPTPVARAPQPRDIVAPFRQTYQAAGSPRIILLWNREINDEAGARIVDQQVSRDSGRSGVSSRSRITLGHYGAATVQDVSGSHDNTQVVTSTQIVDTGPQRSVAMSEQQSTVLRRAFVEEMNRGGLRFVDRALAMRLTAAKGHRDGGDPKLIETDALVGYADLVLEVLLIEDKATPLGYGFDVRVKNLRLGTEVAAVYSRALPPVPDQGPGRWAAGREGYEWRNPPAPPPASTGQVGGALARDVMSALGPSMEAASTTSAAGKASRARSTTSR